MHRRVSTDLAPLLYTGPNVTNGPILFYSYPGINQTNSVLNNVLAAFNICQCDWVTSIAQTPIYIMFGFIGLRFSICLSRKGAKVKALRQSSAFVPLLCTRYWRWQGEDHSHATLHHQLSTPLVRKLSHSLGSCCLLCCTWVQESFTVTLPWP